MGLRPSHNAIPLTNVMPMAAVLDTAGYLARDGDLMARFGKAWYGDHFQSYKARPKVRARLCPCEARTPLLTSFAGGRPSLPLRRAGRSRPTRRPRRSSTTSRTSSPSSSTPRSPTRATSSSGTRRARSTGLAAARRCPTFSRARMLISSPSGSGPTSARPGSKSLPPPTTAGSRQSRLPRASGGTTAGSI
jgi:hypothetical protein